MIIGDEIRGGFKGYKIDVVENKEFSDLLLKVFTDRLHQKGYHVDKSLLSSIGLTLDSRIKYKVINKIEERGIEIDNLPSGVPPFYVGEAFTQNFETTEIMRTLYTNLNNYTESLYRHLKGKEEKPKASDEETLKTNDSKEKEGEKPSVSVLEASKLGVGSEGDVLLVVTVSGFRVSTGKQVTEAVVSSLLTGGMVTMWSASTLVMRVYMVDIKSGQIIWSDHIGDLRHGDQRRYFASKSSLQAMAEKIIERIPSK